MDSINQESVELNFPRTASKTMLSIRNAVEKINAQNYEENEEKLTKEEKSLKIISLDELSSHCSIDDCWIVINDYVYDVTKYLMKHPAGYEVLLDGGGRDATSFFLEAGHSKSAARILEKYLIGELPAECKNSINDNTIWAGCAHGLSFFVLNALISQCAGKRKLMTIVILVVAAAAAAGIDLTGEPLSGLLLFYVFLTTAMVFGVISSYFVTLYPTSYRGMVACLGMMVARLSAFSGTNIISGAMTQHCSSALYGASGLVLTGAVAAALLPADRLQVG